MATGLKKNFVYQFLLSSTQVLVPLATYPYITRVLGPENLGRVNYIDFVAQVFMILATFGIPFYAIREIAKVSNDPAKRSALVKELTIIHVSLAVCCSILFVIVMQQKIVEQPVLCMLAVANILISSFSFEWFITGTEQFKFAAIRTIIIRIGMLVCFFVLVKDPGDYPIFYGIFTAAMLLTAMVNAAKTFSLQDAAPFAINLKKHVRPLFHFFLTASAIGIYEYVGAIILQQLVPNETTVGYFTMMQKIVMVILAMLIAFSGVLLPRISFLVGSGNQMATENYLNKFLQLIMAIGIPTSFGIFIFAPEIVYIVAGKQFLPAIPLLRILCFLPIVVGPTNVFCNQVLVSYQQEKQFMLVAILGCTVSILLNFALVPIMQAQGSAYATLITEAVIAIVSGYMAFKFVTLRFQSRMLLCTIVASLLFWPLAIALRMAFTAPIIILVTGVPIAAIVYLLLQYLLFKNEAIRDLLQYLYKLPIQWSKD